MKRITRKQEKARYLARLAKFEQDCSPIVQLRYMARAIKEKPQW